MNLLEEWPGPYKIEVEWQLDPLWGAHANMNRSTGERGIGVDATVRLRDGRTLGYGAWGPSGGLRHTAEIFQALVARV